MLVRIYSRQRGPPRCCLAATMCTYIVSHSTRGLSHGRAVLFVGRLHCALTSTRVIYPCFTARFNRSDAHFRLACSSVDMEIARCAILLISLQSFAVTFFFGYIPFLRTPLSGEILAMFPNGVSVRCYDCSSVTQVRCELDFDCIVQWRGAFKLCQVPWHPFGLKCLSCGRLP